MDMQVIINQMVVLFILLAAGLLAGKISLLTTEGTQALSKIVLYITAPCTILNSVINGDLSITGGETAFFALMSLSAIVLHIIISIPAIKALGGDKTKHGMFRYLAIFGNVTNMGFPVAIAILGAVSAFYIAIYNIVYILFCYSLGIVLVSGKSGKFDPKKFINPSLIAGILIIIIVITGFKAPYIISETVRLASGITTPAAMLIIGATLSRISIKTTLAEWRLFPVAFIKLIIMPVATWLILNPFVSNKMMLNVLVILSGMASGVMSTIFAIEYGGDERVASGGVFLTTLLSGITIPLIVFFLLA